MDKTDKWNKMNIDKVLKSFNKNWELFLTSSKEFLEKGKFPITGGEIPFLPLEIDTESFYRIWVEFYPLFMNTNATSLEIIIEDDFRIKNCYLHKANKDGMYTDLIKLSLDNFPIKIKDLDNEAKSYKKLKLWVKKTKSIEIGNVRVISTIIIDELVEKYVKFVEKYSNGNIVQLIGEYMDVISSAKKKLLLKYYPKTLAIEFISELKTLIGEISYRDVTQIFNKIFPKKDFCLVLKTSSNYLGYSLKHKRDNKILKYQLIPKKLNTKCDGNDCFNEEKDILKYLKNKAKTKYNFLIHTKTCLDYLKEIFQSKLPPEEGRINFLIQKLLFYYHDYEKSWNCYPNPLIFNELFRYLMFRFGFRLNIRKLSYWSIPNAIECLNNNLLNLSNRIGFIFGDSLVESKIKGFIIDFENGTINNVEKISSKNLNKLINKTDLSPDFDLSKQELKKFNEKLPHTILSNLRLDLSEKNGYVSSLFWIKYSLIEEILSTLIFELHGAFTNPIWKLKKVLKKLKKVENFSIYPENPFIKMIEKESPISLIKRLTAILTDLQEF